MEQESNVKLDDAKKRRDLIKQESVQNIRVKRDKYKINKETKDDTNIGKK